MQKVKIGIIDSEKEYVTKLIAYLKKYDKGKWDLCAFTNVQSLKNHLEKRSLDILIGTDKSVLTKQCGRNDRACLWLTDQKCDYREETNQLYVMYRFQSACEIGKCIERIIQNERKSVDEEKAIIAIYSPVGRCGKTTMALDVASSGRYGKWLYMGLEDYSSFENGNGEKEMMDEAMYYWKERKEDKLLQIMERAENVLVSGTSFFDGKQMNAEDFKWIRSLTIQSSYKGIIFDIGSGIVQNFQIFEEFDKVIVPYITEERALIKKRNFEKLFDSQEGNNDRKLIFVDMDKESIVVKQEIFGGMEY